MLKVCGRCDCVEKQLEKSPPTCTLQSQRAARMYIRVITKRYFLSQKQHLGCISLHSGCIAMFSHTHKRTGVHDSHGWTWGGRCVLELTVPGYRPKMFLNAKAEQTTSKDEPSKSGSVRIKGDSWEQGGWTGQDLFRNHFYSHS